MIRGFFRVLSSPGMILWLWLANVVFALPATLAMASALERAIGGSQVHEKLTEGFDMGWYGEFRAEARGMEESFTPTVLAVGAFLNNLEAWFNGEIFSQYPSLVGYGVVYALLWALFLGGILHRYADHEGVFNLKRFFSRGGWFFFRFVRLGILASFFYYGIYRFSYWLFGKIEAGTQDVTDEATVLRYVVLAAGLVVFLFVFVNMAFDYAKIITYKESRRSMLGAATSGFRFVLAHPGRTFVLYFGLVAVGAVMLFMYHLAAPGAMQSTAFSIFLALMVGQAYLIAKLILRLTFYASQLALFEGLH